MRYQQAIWARLHGELAADDVTIFAYPDGAHRWQATTEAWELTFQVACATADDPACPDLGPIAVATLDGLPEEEEPAPEVVARGACGCQSSSAGGIGALVGLLALARRRRDP